MTPEHECSNDFGLRLAARAGFAQEEVERVDLVPGLLAGPSGVNADHCGQDGFHKMGVTLHRSR
jgi:hypothetical protein